MTTAIDPGAPDAGPNQPQQAQATRTSALQIIVVFLVLLAVSAIAFSGSIHSPLTLLDEPAVVQNHFLVTGEGLERIWRGIWPSSQTYPLPGYQPVTYTSFWIDHAIWGRPIVGKPGSIFGPSLNGTHYTNVLIHALCATLLFGLLKQLRVPGAMLAALLFAVHPIHAQAVSWVMARGYLLAMMFGLMATFAFLRWAGATRVKSGPDSHEESSTLRSLFKLPDEPWKQLAIAGVLFLAAIGAHPSAICFVPAWLVLVWWKKQELKTPVLLAAGVFLVPAIMAAGLWVTMGLDRAGAYGSRYDLVPGGSPAEALARLGVSGAALAKYVQLIVVPFDLMPDHPRWDASGLVKWAGIAVWLIVIGAVVGLLQMKNRPAWATLVVVAIGVTTSLLLPAIFLLDVPATLGGQVVERMSYFGVAAVVSVFAGVAASVARSKPDFAGPASGLAAVLVAVSIGGAFWHGQKYKNEWETWTWASRRNLGSWTAFTQGGLLFDVRSGDFQQSFSVFERAVKLYPQDPFSTTRIARLLEIAGDPKTAVTVLSRVVASHPNDANAKVLLGEMLERQGEFSRAFDLYQNAANVDPRHVPARLNLTQLLLQSTQSAQTREEAIQRLNSARQVIEDTLMINPLDPAALNLYGKVLVEGNAPDQALLAWMKARTITPDDPALSNNIATLHLRVNQLEEAEKELENSIRLNPRFAEALSNLGRLRMRQDNPDEARGLFMQALAIKPNLRQAQDGLVELDRLPATRPSSRPVSE